MPARPVRDARIEWHAHADEAAWVDASIQVIRTALQAVLDTQDEAWLLLSGGSTPAPVYRALAATALAWSRVVVSLVDERDTGPDADGSNARLVRETLLRERAAAARWAPLLGPVQSIEQAVAASNARWPGQERIAIAVLGMGDDGHTASLFPGAKDLDAALASAQPYTAIDASACAGAGQWPRRISLTPAGLAQAEQRLLLIRGAGKRAVFQGALLEGDARHAPIRAAIDIAGAPLRVDWCP